MALTLPQQRALAILPKLSALPSFLGSLYIVFDFCWNHKKFRSSTYRRLMASMSIVDMATSFCYFLSTWPVPSSSPTLWASGTDATCRAQAFVIQFGIAIPFYNLSLALYYYLVAREKKVRRKSSAARRLEPYMHAVPLLAGLGTSAAALSLDLFQSAGLWCWIAPKPKAYRWAFFYAPLWFCIVAVAAVMIAMYRLVRTQEQRSARWNFSFRATNESRRNLSNNVLTLASWYVAAFFFTWVWATISRAVQAVTGSIPFPLLVLFSLSLPGQGLLNFFVYNRSRYLRYFKKNPNAGWCNFVPSLFSPRSTAAVSKYGSSALSCGRNSGDGSHDSDQEGDQFNDEPEANRSKPPNTDELASKAASVQVKIEHSNDENIRHCEVTSSACQPSNLRPFARRSTNGTEIESMQGSEHDREDRYGEDKKVGHLKVHEDAVSSTVTDIANSNITPVDMDPGIEQSSSEEGIKHNPK